MVNDSLEPLTSAKKKYTHEKNDKNEHQSIKYNPQKSMLATKKINIKLDTEGKMIAALS